MSEYVYQPYPKVLYHANGAERVVESAAEHKAAGKAWKEIPPAVEVTPDPKEGSPE